MFAHKIETKITNDGTLFLRSLPYVKGDIIDVIMLKNDYKPEEKRAKRTIGEYAGKVHINENFSEPLSDSFWLGENV